MSDLSEGPGWWLASDGKWYPPQAEQAIPTPPAWPPMPLQPSVATTYGPPKKGRRRLYAAVGAIAVVAVIIVIAAVISVSSSRSKPHSNQSSALTFPVSFAHFSAMFAASAKESSIPASFGNYRMQLYVAAAESATGPMEVTEEDVTPGLPSDQIQPALLEALRSLADTTGLSFTAGPASTTFRSFPAEVASFRSSRTTHTYRGVSFMSSNSRLYLVVATTELFSAFDASLKLPPSAYPSNHRTPVPSSTLDGGIQIALSPLGSAERNPRAGGVPGT